MGLRAHFTLVVKTLEQSLSHSNRQRTQSLLADLSALSLLFLFLFTLTMTSRGLFSLIEMFTPRAPEFDCSWATD